eukprot:TRINITY_DN3219_c0_g2_i3.p1 TRINITY_DN3219_c0_g2~~TRINITY_DN3219_c0_g2_i3.p1  ORF type:complete len:170 (-),score=26.63 TRINITY_DN3219_c0_g2_i3:67-576(-)
MILYSSRMQEKERRTPVHCIGLFFTYIYIFLQVVFFFIITNCLNTSLSGILPFYGWVLVSLAAGFNLALGLTFSCAYGLKYEKWLSFQPGMWLLYFINLCLHLAFPGYFLIMMFTTSEEPYRSECKANAILFGIFAGADFAVCTFSVMFCLCLYSRSYYQSYMPVTYLP